MAVRRKSAHLLIYCKPAPGHAAATGRSVLVAKAIFSISLSFTNIPGFLGQQWLDCQNWFDINWSAVIFILHKKVKVSCCPPVTESIFSCLKLPTLSALGTVLLRALLPTVSLCACLQHLCTRLVPQWANASRVVQTSLRTSSWFCLSHWNLGLPDTFTLNPRSWSAAGSLFFRGCTTKVSTCREPACGVSVVSVGSVVCVMVSLWIVDSVTFYFLIH